MANHTSSPPNLLSVFPDQWRGSTRGFLGAEPVQTPHSTYMVGDQPRKTSRLLLFDRQTDPFQLHNLAPDRPDLVRNLHEPELVPWLQKTGDPFIPPSRSRRNITR